MNGKTHLWGWLILLFAVSPIFSQQPCDCISTGNCPVPITDNGSFQGTLDVTVNGVNDLGVNGLTSVCFSITHTWIGDLNVSLTSPNGTTYLIMSDSGNNYGNCGNQQDNVEVCIVPGTNNPLTNNTDYICNSAPCFSGTCCLTGNWTVPCGGVTDPLTGSVQAPNCNLADFNVPGAPANGTWTLTVNDVCNSDTGVLNNFSLTFANGTQSCISCDADGGELDSMEVVSCYGDPNLLLDLPPDYGNGTAPDTAEYGYVYVISQNGVVIAIDSIADFSGQPEGEYVVCGLSYYIPDSAKLDMLIGLDTALAFSQVASTTAPFCGDFSSNCIPVTILPVIPPTVIDTMVCEGDCITVGGQTVCVSDTLTLQSWLGCDSVVQVTLTPILPDTVAQNATVCAGGCVNISGQNYCAPGPHFITLPTWQGCDSVIHLTFTELNVTAVINPANPPAITCTNTSVTLDGSASTPANAALSWSGPGGFASTQPSIDATTPGTYTLTVTDNSISPACVATASVTIADGIVPPAISVTGPAPQICAGETYDLSTLTIQDSNNTGAAITFHSATPATPANELSSAIVSPVAATTYYILASSGSCSDETSVTLGITSLPTADFTVTTPVCVSDAATITYTGTASGSAVYNWNFDGGNASPGTGGGAQSVTWAAPGTYTVSLTVEENGCTSTSFSQTITVEAPLQQPVISCSETTSSVTFSWNDIPNADSYTVTFPSGHSGTQTGPTSYLVSGLNPGDQVTIQVEAVSSGACGNVIAQQTCTAQDCPVVTIDIQPVSDICRTAMTAAFNLAASVSGGNGAGTISWAGPGITDVTTGAFNPNIATIGANTITATYQEANCSFTEQITINVYQTPVADFTIVSPVCAGDPAIVTFTGSGAGLIYNWDFDGGTATPGAGAGPHSVTWNNGGTYTVTLTVENANGCVSQQASATVTVDDPLPSPNIICNTTTSSVLFTWANVPGATGYNATITSGHAGTQPSPTSFEIIGLTPGEEVSIQVEAIGSGACGNSMAQQTCSAQDCPIVTIVIDPVSDICRSAASSAFDLSATVSGTSGNGMLTWSGSGITDPSAGTFDPNIATIGANNITLTYQEGSCFTSESISINVFQTPVSGFTAPASVCQSETATITYTGSAGNGLIYTWDFDGGTATPGNGAGPHNVTWPAAGIYTVSLTVESADGCVSQMTTSDVLVETPLQTPIITCTSTTTSVEFSWLNVPGATDYFVTATAGQTGTQPTPTSYLFTNLQPEEEVTIELTAIGAGNCPPVTATATCFTEACPVITVDVLPVNDFCLGTASPIQLTGNVSGSDGTGNGSWSGPGIINATLGTFNPTAAGFGQHVIVYTFTEKACVFEDSITIGVYQQPTSGFTAEAAICSDETATVTFTGVAGPGAVFNWNFGGGSATPGTGPGPHEVAWTTPGLKNISLTVTQSGCTSQAFSQQVQVDEALEEPTITCDRTTESVIFTWNDVPNATGYTVTVLNGPTGTQPTPTSYEITGLDAGQDVAIEVTVLGNTICPLPVVQLECSALPCPNISINLEPLTDICLEGTASPVSLVANVSGPVNTGSGSWSGPGVTDPVAGVFDPNVAGVGTHELTYIFQEANCTYEESTGIEIVAPPIADAGEDARISCWEQELNVRLGGPGTSAGPDITYQWTADFGDFPGNANILYPEVTEAGTYTLTVTNAALGCSSQDVVVVDASQDVPVPDFIVSPLSCKGEDDAFIAINAVTGGEEPYYFSLNGAPFIATDTFPYLAPGDYELTVMDAAGCESKTNFTIDDPGTLTVDLTANLVGKNTISAGESVALITIVSLPPNAIDSVQWTNTELLSCEICLDPIATPFETTTFTVTVFSNGCVESDDLTIYVDEESAVYVPNAFSPNRDGTNDVFMIYAGPQVASIKSFLIFDRWGDMVFQFQDFNPNDPAMGWDGTFEGRPMNPGVFVWFAEIEMQDGSRRILEGDVTLVR